MSTTLRYLAHIIANSAYLLHSDLGTLSARYTAIQRDRVLDSIDQLRLTLDRTEQAIYEQEEQEGTKA